MKHTIATLLLLTLTNVARSQTPDMADLAAKVRSGSPGAIEAIAKQGAQGVPTLVTLLQENQDVTRSRAAVAIGLIGPAAKDAVPTLIEMLDLPTPGVSGQASVALGRIGKEAAPAVVGYLKSTSNELGFVRASFSAGRIGPDAKDAAPLIVAKLPTLNTQNRLILLDALGHIGAGARSAMPALEKLASKMEDPSERLALVVAAGQIGTAKGATPSKEILAIVLDRVKADAEPRLVYLEALGKLGVSSKEILPYAENGLRSQNPMVRLESARVVGNIDPNHTTVVSVLIESYQERDPAARKLAIELIGTLQPRDPSCLTVVQSAQSDTDASVRQAATEALAKFKK